MISEGKGEIVPAPVDVKLSAAGPEIGGSMSNEARHTPRPWRFDDAGPLSGNIIRFEILAGSETEPFRVCEIEDSVPDIDAEKGAERVRAAHRDLANARLIAAAPELLDACKTLTSVIQQLIPEPSARGVADVVLAQAFAAIAKAEGAE